MAELNGRGGWDLTDADVAEIQQASDDRNGPEWPAGLPDGQWEVVSDHTLELPLGWPEGCRCVISDGKQVSLGGPCPAHSGAAE